VARLQHPNIVQSTRSASATAVRSSPSSTSTAAAWPASSTARPSSIVSTFFGVRASDNARRADDKANLAEENPRTAEENAQKARRLAAFAGKQRDLAPRLVQHSHVEVHEKLQDSTEMRSHTSCQEFKESQRQHAQAIERVFDIAAFVPEAAPATAGGGLQGLSIASGRGRVDARRGAELFEGPGSRGRVSFPNAPGPWGLATTPGAPRHLPILLIRRQPNSRLAPPRRLHNSRPTCVGRRRAGRRRRSAARCSRHRGSYTGRTPWPPGALPVGLRYSPGSGRFSPGVSGNTLMLPYGQFWAHLPQPTHQSSMISPASPRGGGSS